MRKRIFGRRLNKNTNKRKALFRSLMRSFILNEKLKTTDAKAASIRPEVEKLVTKAKQKGDAAQRDLMKKIPQTEVVHKIIRDLAPRFADRAGGYTRVLKLGNRLKDAAPMVLLQWTETSRIVAPLGAGKGKKEKKAAKVAKVAKIAEKKSQAKKTKK